MRRSEAARYARWSATVALVLATVTVVAYIQRRWSAHVAAKSAPPPAAGNIKQELSHGLTFSKQEGNRKIFTVEASKSTDFRDKDSTLLETVTITIFGKAGDRHDVLRTQSCQYGRTDGSVDCSGDVSMELQSASDVVRAVTEPDSGPPQIVHVETHGVTFDRGNGIASTDQPVHFAFPNGKGDAVGLRYNSDQGTLVLVKGVKFQLHETQAQRKSDSGRMPVRGDVMVCGASLEFHRDAHEMLLHGPAEALSERSQLAAGEMRLLLDSQFRAQRLIAEEAGDVGRPTLTVNATRGRSELTAKQMTLSLAATGAVTQVDAEGEVRGKREGSGGSSDVAAAQATLAFFPQGTEPRELNLTGGVVLTTSALAGGESRRLESEKVRMRFREESDSRKEAGSQQRTELETAETLAPGMLEWTEASAGKSTAETKLRGDRLLLQLDEIGKPSVLTANGHVQTERSVPGNPVQTATGHNGAVQMAADGKWRQMDLDGQVKLTEGDRNASAQHLVFRRAEQTAFLTGSVVVRDAMTQTTAPRIAFHQDSGDIFAEGGVHSVDLSARGGSSSLAPVPMSITAANMQANSKTGQALYSGQARLWQGPSVLEADTIELQRKEKVLIATNNVRAVFPQQGPNESDPGVARTKLTSSASSGKVAVLWHVTAQKLTYYDTESRAHLEHDVTAKSAQQKIHGELMDLYFTRTNDAAAANVASVMATQQISRADATGGVIVEQGGRKAEAERGVYTASDGRFVMSGGNPTIYDGSAGSTTGQKLTFFLADDTIIVDSPTGARTVTKHRVER
jgi:lipopolysaccharide export system protein LptA